MIRDNRHTEFERIDAQSKAFFRGGSFEWERSATEVWIALQADLDKTPERNVVRVNFRAWSIAIAASLLLLIGLTGFIKLHTKSIDIGSGVHQTAMLPDGSSIRINAQSKVSYKPYWWYFDRTLNFEGEGFFEVKKGKPFRVNTMYGSVEVLGTSFNVYARPDNFKVTCVTGKVKVTSASGIETVLTPNAKVKIDKDGKISFNEQVDAALDISWRDKLFHFTATPIHEVFKEIERQYGISITTKSIDFQLYTGNFRVVGKNAEEVLRLVCPPMGLDFAKQSDNVYVIFQNEGL